VITDKSGLNAQQASSLDALNLKLNESRALDADGLLSKRRVEPLQELGYDPLQAEFLDKIAGSSLALSDAEKEVLGKNGFVISSQKQFMTFLRGYNEIYAEHLPVYISADAILEAVHSSYDDILRSVEEQTLVSLLDELLTSMHENLVGNDFDAQTRADVDVYLSVARSLFADDQRGPLAGGDEQTVSKLVQLANEADGLANVELFGARRQMDASQFVPRGHYEDSPTLQRYFKAMMWLGRIDLRIIETQPDGDSVFQRPQYDAMLLLRSLMSDADVERWTKIDGTIQAFVGQSDNMVLPEVDSLVADLGGEQAARDASDGEVRSALEAGGYGMQRIASHVMVNAGVVETLPLNRSFLLFGQRYVVDSHVFSQVVFDRVEDRMMPNPLDAAFAAMSNDGALPLLESELRKYSKYPGALDAVRELADAHGDEFWNANLYNLWLGSLRALSPAPITTNPPSVGMPQVTGTDAWNRRILNTQLASWAELRHDTLLYAKQSYTGSDGCDFPDAYVDPYPEFFEKLALFAERGLDITEALVDDPNTDADRVTAYFQNLHTSMTMLQGIAESERSGTPLNDEQLAYINDAVRIIREAVGCTTVEVPDGWLADLYFDRDQSIVFDPTIADVHTQPTAPGGAVVGKVLHVGTGLPRMMVVTTDGCSGPRAYVGVGFAYHEKITEDFDRLTDSRWSEEVTDSPPDDVPWLAPVLAR